MDASFSLNFNSVETLPGYEARAAFTVNSATVFREDVDIVTLLLNRPLTPTVYSLTMAQGAILREATPATLAEPMVVNASAGSLASISHR